MRNAHILHMEGEATERRAVMQAENNNKTDLPQHIADTRIAHKYYMCISTSLYIYLDSR